MRRLSNPEPIKPTPYQIMMLADLITQPGFTGQELSDLTGIEISYIYDKMEQRFAEIPTNKRQTWS